MSSTWATPLPSPNSDVEPYRPPGAPAPVDWLTVDALPGLEPLDAEWRRRFAIFEQALAREPELREEFATEDSAYDEALSKAYAAGEDANALDLPTSPDERAVNIADARAHVKAAHAALAAYVREAKATIQEHLDEWSGDLAASAVEQDAVAAEADRDRTDAERRRDRAKARAARTRRVGDWLLKAGTSDTFTNRPPSNKRRVRGVHDAPAVETDAEELARITNRGAPVPFEGDYVAVSAERSSTEEAHQAAIENSARRKEFIGRMEAEDRAKSTARAETLQRWTAEQDARRAEAAARAAEQQARAARAAADTHTEV